MWIECKVVLRCDQSEYLCRGKLKNDIPNLNVEYLEEKKLKQWIIYHEYDYQAAQKKSKLFKQKIERFLMIEFVMIRN